LDVGSAALQLLLAFGRARAVGSGGVAFTGVTSRVNRLLPRLSLDRVLVPTA